MWSFDFLTRDTIFYTYSACYKSNSKKFFYEVLVDSLKVIVNRVLILWSSPTSNTEQRMSLDMRN